MWAFLIILSSFCLVLTYPFPFSGLLFQSLISKIIWIFWVHDHIICIWLFVLFHPTSVFKITFIYLFVSLLRTHIRRSVNNFWQLVLFTIWVSGIELRFSGFLANGFTHWAILPANNSFAFIIIFCFYCDR